MLNKVMLIGHATMDPETRVDNSGGMIVKTGIAVNREFTTKQGVKKNEVLFIDITIFGRIAEIANMYLRKGSKFFIEGRLKYDTWTDQNGNPRNKHSIVAEFIELLDRKENTGASVRKNIPDNGQVAPAGASSATPSHPTPDEIPVNMINPSSQPSPGSVPEIDIDEDEIPF